MLKTSPKLLNLFAERDGSRIDNPSYPRRPGSGDHLLALHQEQGRRQADQARQDPRLPQETSRPSSTQRG